MDRDAYIQLDRIEMKLDELNQKLATLEADLDELLGEDDDTTDDEEETQEETRPKVTMNVKDTKTKINEE